MKVFVHDFGGYAFISQLSRELSTGRGHSVVHSTCAAYVSGKGHLHDGDGVRFLSVGTRRRRRQSYAARLVQEIGFGLAVARQVRRERPDVVLLANAPIPTLTVLVLFLRATRTPWVLWHHDVHDAALKAFAGSGVSLPFRVAAWWFARCERWSARQAAAIVAIDETFVGIHRDWGTAAKVTVIPNWAPLDEITPVEGENEWARENRIGDEPTILYAGTLGLKHNPLLLVELLAAVRDRGVPAQLVVVNQGPAAAVIQDAGARRQVPVRLLPFQPHGRLAEVLGSADLLVVLLEPTANTFSVPSKTWSYLCAGRPVLGLMPGDNQAAGVLAEGAGAVFAPDGAGVDAAAAWVADLLASRERVQATSRRAREIAEARFAIGPIARRFDDVLTGSLEP